MTQISKAKAVNASKLAAQIAQFALDKKAENVISLDVKDLTNITDHLPICVTIN